LELKTSKKCYYLQFPNEIVLNQWISKLQEIIQTGRPITQEETDLSGSY